MEQRDESEVRTEKVPLSARERVIQLLRQVLFFAAVVFVAIAIVQNQKPLENGASPPVQLRSYDGHTWDLRRFEGQPIVLNFWATWCPPCMQELPEFTRVATEYADKAVVIGAAVSSPREDVLRTIKRFDIRYPIAEASRDMIQHWNASSLPSTYLLDHSHRVVWSTSGMLTGAQLKAAMEEHLFAAAADGNKTSAETRPEHTESP